MLSFDLGTLLMLDAISPAIFLECRLKDDGSLQIEMQHAAHPRSHIRSLFPANAAAPDLFVDCGGERNGVMADVKEVFVCNGRYFVTPNHWSGLCCHLLRRRCEDLFCDCEYR